MYTFRYTHMYIYILQEEQSLCFLKALQNIHLGKPPITFTFISVNRGSHFQVQFLWQVWDGQLSPSFKSIRLNAFGGGKSTEARHSSMLGS